MQIQILPLDEHEIQSLPEELGFGGVFSNRMFTQKYRTDKGWHDAMIGPYAPFSLDPSTAVFHYAQEIFEGLKAYRRPDGRVNLFRPWENMRRFNQSATRLAMPTIDEEDHLSAIVQLVELEADWVPKQSGASLYIRPFMFASKAALGVYASDSYLHAVITGPVGAYFPNGFDTVSVFVSDQYRRAVRGGVGAAKTGGNYAASLMVGEEVSKLGYDQVLWLDAIEGRYVEEVGSMNICFVYENQQIVTPPLSDSILAGVTRDSIITLGRDLGYEVNEETVDAVQMLADIESGQISEVFGCGTAAVISPVGRFGYQNRDYIINDNKVGPVAAHLYEELTDLQYGRIPDRFGWTLQI